MAKFARVAVDEADVDDEAKVSAEEGEVISENSGVRVDDLDKTVKAASADSGLSVDKKAVERD